MELRKIKKERYSAPLKMNKMSIKEIFCTAIISAAINTAISIPNGICLKKFKQENSIRFFPSYFCEFPIIRINSNNSKQKIIRFITIRILVT